MLLLPEEALRMCQRVFRDDRRERTLLVDARHGRLKFKIQNIKLDKNLPGSGCVLGAPDCYLFWQSSFGGKKLAKRDGEPTIALWLPGLPSTDNPSMDIVVAPRPRAQLRRVGHINFNECGNI